MTAAERFVASRCERVQTSGGRWMPARYLDALSAKLSSPSWTPMRAASGKTRRRLPVQPLAWHEVIREARALRRACEVRLEAARVQVARACAALAALTERRLALIAELRARVGGRP